MQENILKHGMACDKIKTAGKRIVYLMDESSHVFL